MKTIPHDLLLQQLNWRYATKKFDAARKIADAEWSALEQALVLTPSSYGLQPWKALVVTDPATREKLAAASWGQRQITDASHLVVFVIRQNLSAGDVDRYLRRVAEVRAAPLESLGGFRDLLLNAINRPAADLDAWATRQAYIALGNFVTSAALLGIDTTPMEGFEPAKYDAILGLNRDGYATVVVAAAGYRAADDKYAALPKVRFKTGDVIQRVA